MKTLAVEGLEAGYGKIAIVHGIDLVAAAGKITALIGANGAGKTTTLKAIAGLLEGTRGAMRLGSDSFNGLASNRRVELGVALVPEGRMVFPTLSVDENLVLGAIVPRARATMSERRAEMYELFPKLAERKRQAAGSLSGGEQQMLAIARGLMSRPSVMLLDEPTLGLSPLMAELVFGIVERLRSEGLTILMAEQNVHRTLEIADNAWVLEQGRIAFSGPAESARNDPRVREAYLGTG